VWVRELTGRAHAVGLFNRTSDTVKVEVKWEDLGLGQEPKVRDLWVRKDLGKETSFSTELPPHGCVLLRVD
jgi:hypothetical protein